MTHEHGRATNRCEHPDCKAAFARYKKRWTLDAARGQMGTVPAAPIRLHIATLTGQSWSFGAIAGAAGVAKQTVRGIARGRSLRTNRRIAEAILAVSPNHLPAPNRAHLDVMVPALGTRRRLRALQVMGWTTKALAEHTGRERAALDALRDKSGLWVLRSTHEWVAVLYREISGTRGPSEPASRMALARGYVGPTAWDDIDHDAEPEDETTEGDAA